MATNKDKIREARRYLTQAYMLSERIATLKTDLAKVRQPIGGVSYGEEPVQTSDIADLSDRMEQGEAVEERLIAKIREKEAVLNRIRGQIDGMDNNVYATLLYKRYVLMEDWAWINKEMMVLGWRRMYVVHSQALLSFYNLYLIKPH